MKAKKNNKGRAWYSKSLTRTWLTQMSKLVLSDIVDGFSVYVSAAAGSKLTVGMEVCRIELNRAIHV